MADVRFKLGYANIHLENRPIADVLPDDIDAIIDQLSKHLAQNTVRQIRNYLYQVFADAVDRRYIAFNPVLKPRSRRRAVQKEPKRLTPLQARQLLRSAESSFYYAGMWILLVLGVRSGEMCGIRRVDLDLDLCILSIAQQVTDLHGRPHTNTPKRDKKRYLPIPRRMVPLIQAHLERLAKRAALSTSRNEWDEHDLVFPGRGGRPMNPTSVRHMVRRFTTDANLPNVTTHMLRHTAAKFFRDVGTPDEVLGPLLGHVPDITGHYGPPDVEVMRPWAELVWQLLTSLDVVESVGS